MHYRHDGGTYLGCDYCSRTSKRYRLDEAEAMLESLYALGWRLLDEAGQPDTACPDHALELGRNDFIKGRFRKTTT